MSAIEWVISNSTHKGATHAVLMALALRHDKGDFCPSVKELAQDARVAESSTHKALSLLEGDKTIVRVKNGGKEKNGGKTNCYDLPGYTGQDIPGSQDVPGTSEPPIQDRPGTPDIPPPPLPDVPGTQNVPGAHSQDLEPETGTNDIALIRTHAAGDKDSLLSLKAKDSLVLSEPEKDKDKTDSLSPDNLNNGVPDDFEDEPVTEVDIQPVYTRDDGLGEAAVAFLGKIGGLTTLLQDDLKDTVDEFGGYATKLAIIDAAAEVAKAQRGERTPIKCSTWSYAKGILKKQKAEGDLPVEVVFKSDTPSDDFDPFNHDDDLPDPEIEPEPVNAQWRELNDFIQSQNRELYRMHLSQCRFGTFEAGKLSVLVPTERVQTACIWELNHRGVFTKWCQDFWQGLETVEFVLEGELHAHPETG